MLLFHGTNLDSAKNILERGIDLRQCNPKADNGPGFYTTPDYSFAVKCAGRKSLLGDDAVLVYEFDEIKYADQIRHLFKTDVQWVQFIVNNRAGIKYIIRTSQKDMMHNLDAKYKIVWDTTADYKISAIVRQLIIENRLINSDEVKSLTMKKFSSQISFHTKESCSYLKFIEIRN